MYPIQCICHNPIKWWVLDPAFTGHQLVLLWGFNEVQPSPSKEWPSRLLMPWIQHATDVVPAGYRCSLGSMLSLGATSSSWECLRLLVTELFRGSCPLDFLKPCFQPSKEMAEHRTPRENRTENMLGAALHWLFTVISQQNDVRVCWVLTDFGKFCDLNSNQNETSRPLETRATVVAFKDNVSRFSLRVTVTYCDAVVV